MGKLVSQKVQIGSEAWEVRLKGGVLQVVDSQGRERHRSKGHMLTGVYLAMAIAELRPDPQFEHHGPINEALIRRAQEFEADQPPGGEDEEQADST